MNKKLLITLLLLGSSTALFCPPIKTEYSAQEVENFKNEITETIAGLPTRTQTLVGTINFEEYLQKTRKETIENIVKVTTEDTTIDPTQSRVILDNAYGRELSKFLRSIKTYKTNK
jgi:hypothetical protein